MPRRITKRISIEEKVETKIYHLWKNKGCTYKDTTLLSLLQSTPCHSWQGSEPTQELIFTCQDPIALNREAAVFNRLYSNIQFHA